MPRTRRVGDPYEMIAALADKVGKLERRLGPVVDSRHMPSLFSHPGPLVEGVPSPPWRPVHPVTIVLIAPSVGTAPSGDLTIDLELNGSLVRTLTIPSGQFYSEDAVPFTIPAGGMLTATVTAASGAADLSISLDPRLDG